MSTINKVAKKAKVLSNNQIDEDYFLLDIETPDQIRVSPGQFLQLQINSKEQFLRRPFGIFQREAGSIKVLYKIRGDITAKMSLLKDGDEVDIIYPLGNGFKKVPAKKSIFVSGGSGFAPLNFMVNEFSREITEDDIFIIGSRGSECKSFGDNIESLDISIIYVTEDGSIGRKGIVTDALKDVLKDGVVVYASGPIEMLKSVYSLIKGRTIESYFSLESHFACGLGFCWGCVIQTKDGLMRICKDGPVFCGDDIVWEKIP